MTAGTFEISPLSSQTIDHINGTEQIVLWQNQGHGESPRPLTRRRVPRWPTYPFKSTHLLLFADPPTSPHLTADTNISPQHLNGNVGLLFTSRDPSSIQEFFDTFVRNDFSRAGSIATYTFTVPTGVIYSRGGEIPVEDDVPLAHSLETTVRALGMPTRLVNGKVSLDQEFVVCKEGDVLNSNQTRLLKLFGSAMAEFSIKLIA